MENDILSLNNSQHVPDNLEVYDWIKISRLKWNDISLQRKNKAVKKYQDDIIKLSLDYINFEIDMHEYFHNVRNLARKLQNAIIKNFNCLDTLILYSDDLHDLKLSLKLIYAKHHFILYTIQKMTDRIAKKKKERTVLLEIEEEFRISETVTPALKNAEETDEEYDILIGDETGDDDGEADDDTEALPPLPSSAKQLPVQTDIAVLDDIQPEIQPFDRQIEAQPAFDDKIDQDDDEIKTKKKKKKKKRTKKEPAILKAYNNLFGKSSISNMGMKPVSRILSNAGITLGLINKEKYFSMNDFMLGAELVKNALECDIRYLEKLSNELQAVYRNHHSYEYIKKVNLEDMLYRGSAAIIENIFKMELKCTKYLMSY